MSTQAPLRVALIGTAPRALYMYAPVLRGLAGEVEVVAAWGRREESAARLGQALGVPWYVDAERLVRETAPDIGVVCVTYHANGEVGLMAVQAGMNVLLETPIAHRLVEADAIIRAASERGLKIEVAEQFHRRPLEQIKLKLIESGLFGRVYSSFSDFAGHGYHGVSVMRSYLGFDAVPIRVTGSVHTFDLAPHWSRLAQTRGPRAEVQEHGMIEFDGRAAGDLPLDRCWVRLGPALVAQQPFPRGEGHGHHDQPRVGGAGVAQLARTRRRSAAFHHPGTPLGARRWGAARSTGGPHGRS